MDTPDCQLTFKFASTIELQDFFLDAYDFTGSDPQYEGIAAVYFAFTSLSTVGFGDYHPVSTYECIFCAIILLTGVNVFSFLMDTFLQIISSLQELD